MAATPTGQQALDAISGWLRCPSCTDGGQLRRERRSLVCAAGHTFDLARQGYVSLVTGHRGHRGDDAAMVAARERFLAGEHYRPLRSAVTGLLAEHAPADSELVVDLAGGTGHYLSPALDALPRAWGLCVDVSAAALRRAARAHPRAAAIGADVWAALPVRSGSAGVLLSVFGPRDVAEVRRVLAPGGIVVLVAPAPDHLRELRELVGAIGIEPRKSERLAAAFAAFDRLAEQPLRWSLRLAADDVLALTAMGPSARHLDDTELRRATERLPEPVELTADVRISVLRRPVD